MLLGSILPISSLLKNPHGRPLLYTFAANSCKSVLDLSYSALEAADKVKDLGVAALVVLGLDQFGSLVDDEFGCDELPLEKQGLCVVYGFLMGNQGYF